MAKLAGGKIEGKSQRVVNDRFWGRTGAGRRAIDILQPLFGIRRDRFCSGLRLGSFFNLHR